MEQRGAVLQFKSTNELMAAMSVLKSLYFFSVYNGGKSHYITFKNTSEAERAAATLKEVVYARQ